MARSDVRRLKASTGAPEGHVLLGRLGKTFGLEGFLRFWPVGAAEAEAMFEVESVFVDGLGEVTLRDVRPHGKGLVVSFDGVRGPERARRLVNASLYASRHSLPAAPGGSQYVDALRGLPVLIDGLLFGTVREVGGVDGAEILVVDRPEGGETLLPLRAPYLQVSDDAVLVEDPPAGLIDAAASE